jgi:hypothetical protein
MELRWVIALMGCVQEVQLQVIKYLAFLDEVGKGFTTYCQKPSHQHSLPSS